jgi:hypothetical protein
MTILPIPKIILIYKQMKGTIMKITKEFCEAYVAMIPRPLKFSIEFQMVSVVEQNQPVVSQWFNNKQIIEISGSNRVAPLVYIFIRDNADLWSNNS